MIHNTVSHDDNETDQISVFKPPPPPNLSKEHKGVWSGWYSKGDREVSREAAAKGIDVGLVVYFLSLRKKITSEDAEAFLKMNWVRELLERKQIFRVSHVLKNIGEDPDKKLTDTFYSTTNQDLREYIGTYLKRCNKLENSMQQLWDFLNLILDNVVLILHNKFSEASIQCLDKQSDEWKSEVAAKLFLRTYDHSLLPYLNGPVIWSQLLLYNDIKLLKVWINVRNNKLTEINNVPENLSQIFKTFPITSDMINQLNAPEIPTDTRETILNEFSKFGIFNDCEINNLVNILHRIDQSDSTQYVYEAVSKKSSNTSLNNLLQLIAEYCTDNNILHVLNVCVEEFELADLLKSTKSSPHLRLIADFRELTRDFNEIALRNNIFNVSKFLSDDLVSYFNENPLILLSLMFFTKNMDLFRVLDDKSMTISNLELYECIPKLLENFKVLNAICDRKSVVEKCNVTYYDLLEKHLLVDVKELYRFQFDRNAMPNFNSRHLIQSYGYSKEIDYLFYVRQIRPSIASKIFMINEFKRNNGVKEETIAVVQKKLYKLALRNFTSIEVTGSCVAFLEMIGVNSEFLRVSIKAANTLLESGHDVKSIINMFMNVKTDPYQILALLEATVVGKIDFEAILDPVVFINAIKEYELVIKNYPVEQVKISLQSLKNPNLLEHINHSVVHDIQVEERNVLMRERDLRTSFFFKLGVHRSADSLNQGDSARSSMTSKTSFDSNSSSAGSDFLEIDISNTKATLLQTLIRCHNSTDPPRALLQACQLYRNPLLAILATSYEPFHQSSVTHSRISTIAVCPKSVKELLNDCMKNRFPKVLQQSLEIFIPHSPLKYFADFINSCLCVRSDQNVLKMKLEAFRESLSKCRRHSVLSENRPLINISEEQRIRLLQVLCDIELKRYLHCPNIQNLANILQCIFDCDCYVKFNIGTYFNIKNGRKSVVECINKLLDLDLFGAALKIAQIEGLPLDLIVIKEWQHKYKNWDHVDTNFWQNSNDSFETHNITADCVIEFYLHYVDSARSNFEKYELLKLAHLWARKFDLSCKYEIEKRKWMAYIILEDKWKKPDQSVFDEESQNLTYKEMLQMLEHVTEYEDEVTAESLNLLNELLKTALNKGRIWLALKLEKMFGCVCSDLDLLKLSFSLAEGLKLPYELTTEERLLLSASAQFRRLSHRKTFLSSRLSSLSSASHLPVNDTAAQTSDTTDGAPLQDTLALLYVLAEKLKIGSEIAYKVFMTYRISLNIEIPYSVIVSNTDYMKMLKDALEDDCMHKLDVVHDFIWVYNWSKDEIADFICEGIVNAASNYIKSKSDDFLMWNVRMDQEFRLILQLIQDGCSVLGYKIYSYASTVHKAQVLANLDFKISELALVVELLITAHDCFTADCNMEGISNILKKCQTVISHLITLRSWKLIVRLLTGVGRYTEMTYVFQILRANDQFEFLLRKGSRNDSALKIALLDYLKKYCPDNHELYKIVALHFALFSEVALLWEREAQSIIRNLIAISKLEMQNNRLNLDTEPYVIFTNTDGTRRCLDRAVENYTHAAEFHIQGEKLAKAMNTAKQAELIALQISLLRGVPSNGTAVCLLNLNETQISSLVSGELTFNQSFILVQAYNFPLDWASLLFEHCILRNNFSYLNAFLKHLPLTDTMVHDISRKFLNANINTQREMDSMKNVLVKLTSVHTKYRIASELGFTDIVEDLIMGGQLCYLKDTVWKKGYKN
ncbi:hypothetical protein NQ318_018595 [Aromia moschata]|uniref:Spatacsin C-terminal domain-containing protein n=1 Tax=Aromia moschata TaxID=1265417 RepID=A0AAV8ZGS4_9CUCU|nr:hypothetical protein NQ318_018595 [Aromia moschata]